MALPNNPTPNEVVKAVKNLETDKQNTLVSGTNIKTINNESILGSGNISVGGGGTATDVQVDSTSITSGGVANLKTKNGDYNATTNKLVTESDIPDVSTKLDKISTANRVYGTDSSGNQTSYALANASNVGNAVAKYDTAGRLKAYTPSANDDVTNKSYVDTADATALHKTGVESASGIKTFTDGIVSKVFYNVIDGEGVTLISGNSTKIQINERDNLGIQDVEMWGNHLYFNGIPLDNDYVKLSTPTTNTATTTAEKTFNIQTITGDTDTSHVYEIYGLWHLYDTGTNLGWLWSDLWGYSSGSSTLLLNTTSNSRVAQTAFVVPCKCTTTGLKAKLNASADESLIAIFGYRRIQ